MAEDIAFTAVGPSRDLPVRSKYPIIRYLSILARVIVVRVLGKYTIIATWTLRVLNAANRQNRQLQGASASFELDYGTSETVAQGSGDTQELFL